MSERVEEPDGSAAFFPVLNDPELMAVFNLRDVYQKELDRDPGVTVERLREMIGNLDARWPLMNETLTYTGQVRSSVFEFYQFEPPESEQASKGYLRIALTSDQKPETVDYGAVDVEFFSTGFAVTTEPFIVGGEVVGEHHELRLALARTVLMNIDGEEKPRELQLSCSAPADGSVHIQSDYESPEFARIRCHEYFPELTDKLEDLHTDPVMRLADKILALRDNEIVAPAYITEQELRTLSNFSYEMLGIEYESVPFDIKLQRGAALFSACDTGGFLQRLTNDNALIQIAGITAHPKVTPIKKPDGTELLAIDNAQIEYRLNFAVLADDFRKDSPLVAVRLRDIKELTNLRHFFHPGESFAAEDEVN